MAAHLGMLVLVLTIGTQGLPEGGVGKGAGVDVLGRIEVRGQRSYLSDGRTARNDAAASGLTVTAAAARRGHPTPGSLSDELIALGVVVADAPHVPEYADTPDPAIELRIGAGASPLAGWEFPALSNSDLARRPGTVSTLEPPSPPSPTPTPGAPAAAPPVPEEPVPVPVPTPVDPLEVRGAEALELVRYPWAQRLPDWEVSFSGARAGMRGLTFSQDRRIEIYIRPGDDAWDIARVLVHEIGHAVDLSLLDSRMRNEWLASRGIGDGVPWWPESGLSDFATGAGDFAECFATWQVGSVSLSAVGGTCSDDHLALVAQLS